MGPGASLARRTPEPRARRSAAQDPRRDLARVGRALAVLVGLGTLLGCAHANIRGRAIDLTEEPYSLDGEPLSYWRGSPRGVDARTLPRAIFLEGDGPRCQAYSEALWTRTVSEWTGDYVLIRPRTRLSTHCADGSFAGLDFSHRLADLAALVAALEERSPGTPTYLVGHSAGAHVAVSFASREGARIAGVASLGGGLDELATVLEAIPRERLRRGTIDASEAERQRLETLATLADVRRHGPSPEPFWGRTYRFWSEMFFSGSKSAWARLDAPIFVAHGVDDLDSVPFSLVASTVDELKDSGRDVTFVAYADLGHDLLRPEVFADVDRWITASEAKRRRPSPSAPASPTGPLVPR